MSSWRRCLLIWFTHGDDEIALRLGYESLAEEGKVWWTTLFGVQFISMGEYTASALIKNLSIQAPQTLVE